jgi:DNA-binding Lrp family transcriptional regulator
MADNSYYNGKTPSIWTVLPSRSCNDKRFKKNPTTFLVLAQLGQYTNRAGVCFPNQSTIAKNLGVSQPAISQHIKKLVEWGYISYLKRNKFHKNLKGNKYFMIFDEKITPDEAISAQKTEHQEEVMAPLKDNVYTKPKTDDKKNKDYDSLLAPRAPSKEARQLILEYKELVRKIFGHTAVNHTVDHERLADTYLANYSKEYILNRMESTLQWRLKNNKDSIKSIVYFKNVFTKEPANKKSSPKKELDQLLNKFTSTHRVKF